MFFFFFLRNREKSLDLTPDVYLYASFQFQQESTATAVSKVLKDLGNLGVFVGCEQEICAQVNYRKNKSVGERE